MKCISLHEMLVLSLVRDVSLFGVLEGRGELLLDAGDLDLTLGSIECRRIAKLGGRPKKFCTALHDRRPVGCTEPIHRLTQVKRRHETPLDKLDLSAKIQFFSWHLSFLSSLTRFVHLRLYVVQILHR